VQQPSLDFDAPARETLNDKLAALFRKHPNRWLDLFDLVDVGGLGGWRTRLSELRHPPYNMPIEWRLERWPDGRNRSQYRYVPAGMRAA
jgi:hypothetical protein